MKTRYLWGPPFSLLQGVEFHFPAMETEALKSYRLSPG